MGLRADILGRTLEGSVVTPVNPACSQKGRPMWIYDGEQWIEEGVNENQTKPEHQTPRPEEFQPELQVVEIVPVPKTNYVPPFPLP